MPRLFWANFDFEHELAEGDGWQPTKAMLAYSAAQFPALQALAGPDDRILLPGECDLPSRSEWELIPWGVTAKLQSLAMQRGWRWNQPAPDLVRRLNDRRTSFEWELRSGTLPRGTRCLANTDEFASAVADLPGDDWIIKARFGMSGRERISGRGEPMASQWNWIRKRLARQGMLFLEPRLDSLGEVGLQWDIPQAGTPKLLAVLPLISSPQGAYAEHRQALTGTELQAWNLAIEVTTEIAKEFQHLGYFGPLGFDAMRYRDGDVERIRPVQDINARWTMGRLVWESRDKSAF